VTVRPMDRALSATPAALLAGQGDVTAVFTLREAGTAEGIDWLEATPRERDTGFERVRIGMKGNVPAAMELHDSLGGRTVLRFSEFRAGAKVDAGAFRFHAPKGPTSSTKCRRRRLVSPAARCRGSHRPRRHRSWCARAPRGCRPSLERLGGHPDGVGEDRDPHLPCMPLREVEREFEAFRDADILLQAARVRRGRD